MFKRIFLRKNIVSKSLTVKPPDPSSDSARRVFKTEDLRNNETFTDIGRHANGLSHDLQVVFSYEKFQSLNTKAVKVKRTQSQLAKTGEMCVRVVGFFESDMQ